MHIAITVTGGGGFSLAVFLKLLLGGKLVYARVHDPVLNTVRADFTFGDAITAEGHTLHTRCNVGDLICQWVLSQYKLPIYVHLAELGARAAFYLSSFYLSSFLVQIFGAQNEHFSSPSCKPAAD